MKVVLDTNVLVSAFLKPQSQPARILRLILQGDLTMVVNAHMLGEYREVLKRPKFDLNMQNVEVVLDFIRASGLWAPSLASSFGLPDPEDEPFLEAALAVGAQALITGNARHFPKMACRGQKVCSPEQFLGSLR